jgi:hypothetical protein
MPDPMRHKVGDKDPAGMKNLHDAMAGKTTPPVKMAPVPAKSKSRDFLATLRDALNEHIPREPMHDGKSMMQTVDEAVKGADGSNPDY